MATRATYAIGDMTFYIHYDGYPTGAAAYFAAMVDAYRDPATRDVYGHDIGRGGLPFAFIRGNRLAEPTERHESHGDTEWRYDLAIDANGVIGLQVQNDATLRDEWKLVYRGDFLDWYRQQRLQLDSLPELVGGIVDGKMVYATRATAEVVAERWTKEAEAYAARAAAPNMTRHAAKLARDWQGLAHPQTFPMAGPGDTQH